MKKTKLTLLKRMCLRMDKQKRSSRIPKEFRHSSNNRQELLKLLKKYWARHNDLRLGQLLQNLVPDLDLFYLEDKTLFDMLKQRVNIKIQKEFLD